MQTLALSKVYQRLEPGPLVLLTTAHEGRINVITLSWHMMVELAPKVVKIGNCSGRHVAKFERFELTPLPALRNSKTIHHRGYGKFVVDGETIRLKSRMR